MAAAVVPFVSVQEYLSECYEPDMDYVDGVLEDRNVGEFDHARVQKAILFALAKYEAPLNVFVIQELRVQTAKSRYRVPDICVLPNDQLPHRIVTQPPLLCVEVLSPEDRFSRIRVKCLDYLRMGVPEVWIFDPASRTAHVLRGNTMTEYATGSLVLEDIGLELPLAEVFGVLGPQTT